MISNFLHEHTMAIWITLICVFVIAQLVIAWARWSNVKGDDAELTELRQIASTHKLILPELKSAIDLLYAGKVKDARNKLCRIRNTIAPIED